MVFTHFHSNMEVFNVSRFPRTEPEIAAVLDWREGRCVIVHGRSQEQGYATQTSQGAVTLDLRPHWEGDRL